MKKICDLVLITFVFFSIAGIGVTAGFFCFITVCKLLWRIVG
ncbi:Sodium:solute symporter [Enterobacter roggenkampii]|nr:sodium:solute symporter [Enterobacter cloacae subsp. cloacae]